jgi:hypothetical protein
VCWKISVKICKSQCAKEWLHTSALRHCKFKLAQGEILEEFEILQKLGNLEGEIRQVLILRSSSDALTSTCAFFFCDCGYGSKLGRLQQFFTLKNSVLG